MHRCPRASRRMCCQLFLCCCLVGLISACSSDTGPGPNAAQTAYANHETLFATATANAAAYATAVNTHGAMPGSDAQQERSNMVEQLLSPRTVSQLHTGWSTQSGGAAPTSFPVVTDRVIYVTLENGSIAAYNIQNGQQIWNVDPGSSCFGSNRQPVVVAGVIYLCSAKELLKALDANSGKTLWTLPLASGNSVFVSPFTVANGILYFQIDVAGSAAIEAVSLQTRTVLWKYPVSGGAEQPAADGATVYTTEDDGTLYALDAQKGTLRWQMKSGIAVSVGPIVSNGMVYYPTVNGSITAVQAASGQKVWTKQVYSPELNSGFIPGLALNNGIVFVTTKLAVLALNAAQGTVLWQENFPAGSGLSPNGSAPFVANGVLYLVFSNPNKLAAVYLFDNSNGRRLKTLGDTSTTGITFLTVANGVVYCTYDGGVVTYTLV